MRIFYAHFCGAFDVAYRGKKDGINLEFVLKFQKPEQGDEKKNRNCNNNDDMVC